MRHRVYGRHLGRDKNQRAALFKSLVQNLFLHEEIKTTQAKAKAVKGLIDKLITNSKNSRFELLEKFLTNTVSKKLISDLTPRLQDRVSGYTSIVRLGSRKGDNAMMVRMSLLTSKKELSSKNSESSIKPRNTQKKTKTKKEL